MGAAIGGRGLLGVPVGIPAKQGRKKENGGVIVKKGNVSQITLDKETGRLLLDGKALRAGDCLEVLVVNGLTGRVEWVADTLEMVDADFVFGQLLGYQVSGLFARRIDNESV